MIGGCKGQQDSKKKPTMFSLRDEMRRPPATESMTGMTWYKSLRLYLTMQWLGAAQDQLLITIIIMMMMVMIIIPFYVNPKSAQ